MNQKEIETLVGLEGHCSYNDVNKAEFKRLSMKLLRELRKLLGIEADVRYNAGGIAVSGDATLHGDAIYVSFNADGCCGLGILFRTCKGRRDFTGGTNCWFSFRRLAAYGVEGLANYIGDRGRECISTKNLKATP